MKPEPNFHKAMNVSPVPAKAVQILPSMKWPHLHDGCAMCGNE